MSRASEILITGSRELAVVLVPLGFAFRFGREGRASGGYFASAEFVRRSRRIEFHFRYGLGLVRYHIGDQSVSHRVYMKALGCGETCQYPNFSDDPLDSFKALAHDLQFAGDFLNGSGTVLRKAAALEANDTARQLANHKAGYAGDLQRLDQMKNKFKQSKYAEVVALADSLSYPERLTTAQRKMVEIAAKRSHESRPV